MPGASRKLIVTLMSRSLCFISLIYHYFLEQEIKFSLSLFMGNPYITNIPSTLNNYTHSLYMNAIVIFYIFTHCPQNH